MNNKEGDPLVWKKSKEIDACNFDLKRKRIEQKIDTLIVNMVYESISRLSLHFDTLTAPKILKKEEMEQEIIGLINALVKEVWRGLNNIKGINIGRDLIKDEIEQKIGELIVELIHRALGRLSKERIAEN